MSDWYAPLRAIQSRGSQADRPGSLAGLAAARREHMGQFFTPDDVVRVMWEIVNPAMDAAIVSGERSAMSILDNSVGSARLLQFAQPDKHALYGVDVDAELMVEVGKVVQDAGFTCEFEPCGMEMVRPHSFDVGLINPPFSVNLQSPCIEPYPCTAYGKYGPSTSVVSHAYALAQAVDACEMVVALLPATFAEEVVSSPGTYLNHDQALKLSAIIELPRGVFREENTDVAVALLVFALDGDGFQRFKMASLKDPVPQLGLRILGQRLNPKLRIHDVEDDGPSITLPVTGDKKVRVAHDGPRIVLRCFCGLTHAKVMNAVLVGSARDSGIEKQRLPRGVLYSGQGALNMEVHLAQDDPEASVRALIQRIRNAGGEPDVDPGLWGYLCRRIRRNARQKTPLNHWVYVPDGIAGDADTLTGRARKTHVADPKMWGSPAVQIGQNVTFQRQPDGSYTFTVLNKTFSISPEALHERFEVMGGAAETGWVEAHAGLLKAFPQMALAYRKRAIALGLDKWLTWDFQLDDVIELAMCPDGAIAAWDPGLGKARLASALITLHGSKHGLIVTESGLIGGPA